jgi:hypothetical protein
MSTTKRCKKGTHKNRKTRKCESKKTKTGTKDWTFLTPAKIKKLNKEEFMVLLYNDKQKIEGSTYTFANVVGFTADSFTIEVSNGGDDFKIFHLYIKNNKLYTEENNLSVKFRTIS